MTKRLGLIVTDASPLITLAAGEALDCLTLPGLPVIIPDMVYFEVTQDLARTGAEDIVRWSRRHRGQVEIVPTSVFSEFQIVRAADPRARSKGRGEQAAVEIWLQPSRKTRNSSPFFCSRTTTCGADASCGCCPSTLWRSPRVTFCTSWKPPVVSNRPTASSIWRRKRSATSRRNANRRKTTSRVKRCDAIFAGRARHQPRDARCLVLDTPPRGCSPCAR